MWISWILSEYPRCGALISISDNFESFKRKTNRTTREIQLDISTIKDDINTIYERLPEEKKKK